MTGRFFRALPALVAATAMWVAAANAAQTDRPPAGPAAFSAPVTAVPPVPAGADPLYPFWRKVRSGAPGYVPGPASQPRRLIVPIDKDAECIKAGTCTHRLVGFALPIHQKEPPVRPPIGRGPTKIEAWFVFGIAMALMLAGLAFIGLRLGGLPPEDAS